MLLFSSFSPGDHYFPKLFYFFQNIYTDTSYVTIIELAVIIMPNVPAGAPSHCM